MDEDKSDIITTIRARKSTKKLMRLIERDKRESDEHIILRLINVYKKYKEEKNKDANQ
jgi:hypothetical protein